MPVDAKDIVSWGINAAAALAAGVAIVFAARANGIARQALDLQRTPAKLDITVADPIWLVEKPQGTVETVPTLIATVTTTNDGAQQGCIHDLSLIVTFPVTGDEGRFTPQYFMNPREVLAALAHTNPIFQARSAQFGPIVVLGKQQVSEAIGFYAAGVGKEDFHPGTYSVRLLAAECSARNTWNKYWTGTYVFTQPDIDRLLDGGPAVHDSEERRKAIQSIPSQ